VKTRDQILSAKHRLALHAHAAKFERTDLQLGALMGMVAALDWAMQIGGHNNPVDVVLAGLPLARGVQRANGLRLVYVNADSDNEQAYEITYGQAVEDGGLILP
jgi:hypothetical protein